MRFVLALLSASLPLLANGQAQLLPAGEFKARDGRPGPGKTWKLSDEQGRRLAADLNASLAAEPLLIDFEHQTFHKERNGQMAPAAGWVRSVEWLTQKGLIGAVDWTRQAQELIETKAYRYISPVIQFDRDSLVVTGLHMAALTNTPALKGLDEVQAALTALNGAETEHPQADTQEPPMKLLLTALSTLLAMPALAAATTEAEALTLLQGYKPPKAAIPEALTTLLGLQAGADEAAALSAIARLQQPDASTAQTIATLTSQLNALTAQINGTTVASAVDAAIAAGKLAPAQRDVYLKIGATSMELLTATLASLQPIPGLAGQKVADKTGDDRQAVTALTADQSLIAQQLGIAPDAYLRQLQQAA